jgi:hypothetical protein
MQQHMGNQFVTSLAIVSHESIPGMLSSLRRIWWLCT